MALESVIRAAGGEYAAPGLDPRARLPLPSFPLIPPLSWDADDDMPPIPPPYPYPPVQSHRLPGACRRCKRLKMKCEFADSHGPCRRCVTGEHSCTVEPRTPGVQHATRTTLVAQLRERDRLLAELLRHAQPPLAGHESPDADSASEREDRPARASQACTREPAGRGGHLQRHAHAAEYMPRELPAHNVEILARGTVLASDIDGLFALFFDFINPCISLLDPALHSPRFVLARCPFLFTAVCAVAARHLDGGSMYAPAMACARREAAAALIGSPHGAVKGVEMVQGYLLIAEYAPMARSWVEDRSMLFQGLATGLATDIGIHLTRACMESNPELMQLNDIRTWNVCAALEMQPPPAPSGVPLHTASLAAEYDVYLCAEVELARVVARFRGVLGPDPGARDADQDHDCTAVLRVFDDALATFRGDWKDALPGNNSQGGQGARSQI